RGERDRRGGRRAKARRARTNACGARGEGMRTAICTCVVVLALIGQQKPTDVYASAIAKYVAGDSDAAFAALAKVSHLDVQKELEATIAPNRATGGSPASRRRLEAAAMLHTEYALLGGIDPDAVVFHIDMAHLALSVSRLTVTGQMPGSTLGD